MRTLLLLVPKIKRLFPVQTVFPKSYGFGLHKLLKLGGMLVNLVITKCWNLWTSGSSVLTYIEYI